MSFDNVRFVSGNASSGPTPGRAYTIDYLANSMVVKTYPGGSLIATYPLNTSLANEVISLDYDNYYFYTLSRLGISGNLGVVINKWLLKNSILEKQLGVGNEIVLNNTSADQYAIDAFCVHRYETELIQGVIDGATSVRLQSLPFLEVGDSLYLGPSSVDGGVSEERTVSSISGDQVYFNQPTNYSYSSGDKATYRRNIWAFNNRQGLLDYGGSLLQIDSYMGYILTKYTSAEWRGVTAATCSNGNLVFVRGSQLLSYKPFGSNAGYQFSSLLNNVKNDNSSVIKVYDIFMDSAYVYKLQRELHEYSNVTGAYTDVSSVTGNFEIEQEQLAAKVRSLTVKRGERSIFFGPGAQSDFTIIVKDQYDFPVFNRNVNVQEDDISGFIPSGFSALVTNSLGQCVTRYNSGVAPEYAIPTLRVIDVATNYRVSPRLLQFKGVDSSALLQQDTEKQGKSAVEQVQRGGVTALQQDYLAAVPFAHLEQRIVTPSFTILLQDIAHRSGFITQDPKTLSQTYLQQNEFKEDFTFIDQYNFLIFALPTPYSIKNSPNTNILLRISGFGATPLNTSTLKFVVNGIDVTEQVVVTQFSGGIQLDYDPAVDFPYASVVSIFVEVDDTNIPPRTVSTSYTFEIVGDFKKPYLYQVFPPEDSTNNVVDTEIYAIIKDAETGINLNSIQMFVEGVYVTPVVTVIDSYTIKVSYQTADKYIYDSSVMVSIFAEDIAGNYMFDAWSFYTQSSAGILFTNMNPPPCEELVLTDTNICTELFGLQDGINLNSFIFTVDGVRVNYLIKPKVYYKE